MLCGCMCCETGCTHIMLNRLSAGIRAAPLTSSITHVIPVMKDLLQWFGGYEVTREGFTAALKKEKSVIVVPGGQHEMMYSQSWSKRVVVSTRHRGFFRLAIKLGVRLVPVYSFGEIPVWWWQ